MAGIMFGLALLQANNPCAVSVCNSSLFSLPNLRLYDITADSISLNDVVTFSSETLGCK